MEPLAITLDKETITGWHFTVSVGQKGDVRDHEVVLAKTYWEALTKKNMPPQMLVFHSFVFLLGREKKEEILTSFNLRDIKDYFPEYEKSMEKHSRRS